MEAVDRASQQNGTDASPEQQAISTEIPHNDNLVTNYGFGWCR